MLTKKLEPRVARSIDHLLRHLDAGDNADSAAPWSDEPDLAVAIGYSADTNLDHFSIELGCVIG